MDYIRKLVSNWPQYISYENSDPTISKFYDEALGAVTNENSIFHKKRLLEIFIFSMAIGKFEGMKMELKKKSRSMPTDALKAEEIWLMTAVALAEPGSNIDILTKPSEIVNICEQYANAGIQVLMSLDKDTITSDPLGMYEDHFKKLVDSIDIEK
jgi:hypothetical protein